MGTITIEGIPIEVQKKRIKNLHLHVKADGSVYVTIPRYVSLKEAENFARANVDWIRKQQGKIQLRPSKEDYEAQKESLMQRIRPFLWKWEGMTDLRCKSWHVRYMTSRWGSCIPEKGRICFNLQLADKSDACLEYVILHELLHLKYRGHGEDFKQELTRYMPEWKYYQKLLKQ
ncbi:MAG: DUF45 domain-containing protein [Parasporobacterium sp.]|jgi:predicted metal-dependent hydrolase|nr:DUF45 domain-containing protein [Lachnospiraceae bacterium]MBR3642580.1 DUF45 domain-containing protein [Parasporobacterium sp.]